MFRRILIANRGEVAARIARTCRRMGVETVAVASEADQGQAWLAETDRVVRIGPPHASASYLDADALIEVARHHRCSAIHPGWGFLAENACFAVRCAAAGLSWVGPDTNHLVAAGDKVFARRMAASLGLPVIPGSDGVVPDAGSARMAAERIGYPVLLKAVAGGGGRGMRAVTCAAEMQAAFDEASTEALSAFGDGRLYLERRIVGGRHVEVQVLCDRYGNCVHLGERECSIQRRWQKILEEAPSPALGPAMRASMIERVMEGVRHSGYCNAGTVEMLVDRRGNAWFLEVNARLQVEHTVTEESTGVDLVEMQLRIAANEPLPIAQGDVAVRAHSIECRINAEDPDAGFAPSPGSLTALHIPQGEGIRVDTHLRTGDRVTPWYDSMIAKVNASGRSRADAIRRMRNALAAMKVEGVRTNLQLHRRILESPPFETGRYDTGTLESMLADG